MKEGPHIYLCTSMLTLTYVCHCATILLGQGPDTLQRCCEGLH